MTTFYVHNNTQGTANQASTEQWRIGKTSECQKDPEPSINSTEAQPREGDCGLCISRVTGNLSNMGRNSARRLAVNLQKQKGWKCKMKSYVWEKDVVPGREMTGFKIKQRLNYRNYIKTRSYSPSKGTWKNESVNSDSRGCSPVLKLHSCFQKNSFFFQNKSFFSVMAHSYVRSVVPSYTLQGRGLNSDIWLPIKLKLFLVVMDHIWLWRSCLFFSSESNA